jgi:branched-chain amino acid transport system substrate-binding protein
MKHVGGIIMLLLLVACATEQAKDPITIGSVIPLSGDGAFWGTHSKNAMEFAVADINSNGGINGRPLQIIYEDSKCDPKTGVTGIQKLISVDRVPVVIGDACSSVTIAMAPVAQSSNIVLITQCSEATVISEAGDYIFRTWTPTNKQAQTMAKYAATHNLKRVAVLTELNDFGASLNEGFQQSFPANGGTIVATESYTRGKQRDFRTQLLKIKQARPDAIYLTGYYSDGVNIVKQMHEIGLNATIMITSGMNSEEDFFKPLGALSEGILISDLPDSTSSEFQARYRATYDKWPGMTSCASVAYDDVLLVADAMRAVGTDSEKIRDHLAQTKNFPGVSGPLTFDANGDLDREHAVFVWKNGKQVPT